MGIETQPRIGYIELQFFDTSANQVVSIGGAGFDTVAADNAAWADIERFEGESAFMADRLNAEHDIVDDKPVSAETCERLMGRPIAQLIANGRAKLKADLAALKESALE